MAKCGCQGKARFWPLTTTLAGIKKQSRRQFTPLDKTLSWCENMAKTKSSKYPKQNKKIVVVKEYKYKKEGKTITVPEHRRSTPN